MIRKNHYPKILFVTIDDDDDEFVHLVADDELSDVVCKSTKKIAVYKLERVEKFNWDKYVGEEV